MIDDDEDERKERKMRGSGTTDIRESLETKKENQGEHVDFI